MRGWLAGLLTAVLLVCAACTPSGPQSPSGPPADDVVSRLVAGLASFDVSGVGFVQEASDAQEELSVVTKGLGSLRPKVEAGAVTYQGDRLSVPLHYRYEVGSGEWAYDTQAAAVLSGGSWLIEWSPAIVHPEVTAASRLRLTRTAAPRAPINGSDGLALMESTPVTRVGIDKANLDKSKWDSSARQLAAVMQIDVGAYAARVSASGEKAFVVAATVRRGELPAAVSDVPGIYLSDTTAILGPTPTFASGLLGVTGDATAEAIEKGKGAVVEGDVVGLTGLQQRQDERLRGKPGYSVELVARPAASPSTKPSGGGTAASGSASPRASASGASGPTASSVPLPRTLFEVAPVQGEPLQLTLNRELQFKAEAVLASQPVVASLVVMNKDGSILAAANSPTSGANPYATTGRYPPGSTFKIITTLALLRKGLTPSSSLNCTPTYTVGGRSFPNYEGYPQLGSVPLSSAFAYSCNTAFMRAGEQLSNADLASAAASLGFGVDYNPGFASFYGSVPAVDNSIAKGAGMIGQGQVEASPMAMAGVVASLVGGKTVVPWLIKGATPAPTAEPLTSQEASTLRGLMGGVVSFGTAHALRGVVDGAKTGTAQFGAEAPYKKHAWLVAWKGDVIVAAFVYEGQSGSATAGPIVSAFFGGG